MHGDRTLIKLLILQANCVDRRAGILLAAVVLMAVGYGVHGGGPIGKLLLIATPINFFLYLVICLAVTKIAKILTGRQNL